MGFMWLNSTEIKIYMYDRHKKKTHVRFLYQKEVSAIAMKFYRR